MLAEYYSRVPKYFILNCIPDTWLSPSFEGSPSSQAISHHHAPPIMQGDMPRVKTSITK